MSMIRIYTIENCQYCQELKNLLITNNLEYTEVNVDLPENEAEYNKLYELVKTNDVPIIKVKYNILVPKISFTSISEAVEITKKILT